ncbi:hypothetical protein ACTI_78800 [Actinoplanes sp. OR16]|uniref:hypothetical protein n=1 Tax=Actinoplanes sp. OR16 TaxID=946334 RepID=UPI000F70D546|nr:hypothetical protein [Actinoplanes sp. OR16]BBH71195.1 hypothetical protein ACTI_78800 [Actinoplanes sp. OR16]
MPDQPSPEKPQQPERNEHEVRWNRIERRRERIYRQIQKDRAGNHKIPTWLYTTVLGLLIIGWIYLIVTS